MHISFFSLSLESFGMTRFLRIYDRLNLGGVFFFFLFRTVFAMETGLGLREREGSLVCRVALIC